jgi:ABC-2 type transport system ATP-binding protein
VTETANPQATLQHGEPIICATDLTKIFRRRVREKGRLARLRSLILPRSETISAVSDVTFEIKAQEIVGYIGCNGAGKSTTIKCLTGILVPTSGHVSVAGLIPHTHRMENARNIGVVFGQKSQLWWDVPARASFEVLQVVYRIPDQTYARNLALLDELLELRGHEGHKPQLLAQIGYASPELHSRHDTR